MYCRGGNLPPAVGRFIFYISEQNGSEKRSRVDATFRRNYRRRNLREGYRHCPPQRSALKEVLKPWVSSGVFFRTFFSLLKRKCKHFRIERLYQPSPSFAIANATSPKGEALAGSPRGVQWKRRISAPATYRLIQNKGKFRLSQLSPVAFSLLRCIM